MGPSLLFLFLAAGSVVANIPEATLFSEKNCEGESFVIPLEDGGNIPDLSIYGFTDETKSILLAGSWIFYASPNYNNEADQNENMPFYFKNLSCTNTVYNVASVRVIGDPTNITANTITVFDDIVYTGDAQVVNEDTAELNPPTSAQFSFSLAITGSSAWTFFSEKNFMGVAKCYQPGDSQVTRFEELTGALQPRIYRRDAKSIRCGCHMKEAIN